MDATSLPPQAARHLPPAENSKVVRSRDGHQGGEMAVSVTELESLDMPRAGVDRVADRPGARAGENGLGVLFPGSVQRPESRGGERLANFVESLVEVVAARRSGMRANLLEVPAQFVQRLASEGCQKLIQTTCFERWAMSGKCGGTTIRRVHAGSARSSAA